MLNEDLLLNLMVIFQVFHNKDQVHVNVIFFQEKNHVLNINFFFHSLFEFFILK